MQKRGKSFQIIISLIEAVVILALLASFIYIFVTAKSQSEVYDVSEGWDVTIDGETYEDINIKNFIFPKGMKDVHEIVMHKHLSLEKFPTKTLRVYTRLSYLEVRLGDEVLYYDGFKKGNPRSYLGMGYHFIQMPTYGASDDLNIRIIGVENNAITGLPDVTLTSTNVAYSYFVDENAIGIFASIFVFMLGLVLTLISILYTYLNRDYFRLFLVGSFALTAGLWCMCSQKFLLLFGVSVASNSSIEFFLMEMTLLPLLGYDIKVRSQASNNAKLTIRILLSITLVYDLVAAWLHFTDVIHYSQFVYVFYVLALVDSIAMIFVGVGPEKKMRIDEKVFHYAMSLAALFTFWKIIDYIYGNFLVRGAARLASVTIPIVILLFVGALVLSYLCHLYDLVLSQAQEEALTVLAYKDALTGLYNRTKCEQIFERLNNEKDTPYVLIDFDLNGLKKLNDSDGHAKGDCLIAGFGKVLNEVFGAYGNSMRMGGDEFLTIMEGKNLPDIDLLLRDYIKKAEEVSKEIGIEIDASYGVAYSSEVYEPEAEQIFRMADERMYDMKVRTKKVRGN